MKPLSKSIIITSIGYLAALIGQTIIYPLFGLVVNLKDILSLGLIFTGIALVSNYCSLKAIEYFESQPKMADANESQPIKEKQ